MASVARGRTRPFGAFDGLLSHPFVAADVAKKFGPEKVFSPTALETYVACPFRFWLEHVLRLEPLDDPGDEVEHTRRGSAVHRALARFHAYVRDRAGAFLADKAISTEVDASLEKHLAFAVDEYAGRAADPGTRVLWRLEGQRLLRQLARYRGQWDKFRDPWHANGPPTPHAFEADFGTAAVPPLTLTIGDAEIRLGGRIDRIDIAELGDELGFWVIDYKTGGGAAYTAAAVQRFELLQLPLYAIAVERVILAGRSARPLGLAYWLIAVDGPKVVLPTSKSKLLDLFQNPAAWPAYRDRLEAWVGTLVGHIREGHFPLAPRSETCTDTCPMGPVCRIAASRSAGKEWPMSLPVVSPPPIPSIG